MLPSLLKGAKLVQEQKYYKAQLYKPGHKPAGGRTKIILHSGVRVFWKIVEGSNEMHLRFKTTQATWWKRKRSLIDDVAEIVDAGLS